MITLTCYIRNIIWENAVYGDVDELKLADAPKPLGAHVILTHYVDVNLCHNILKCQSITGIIQFINQTHIYIYITFQRSKQCARQLHMVNMWQYAHMLNISLT